MSMGNYLWRERLGGDVMATKQPRVAVDHPTVVPENYDAADDADEDTEGDESVAGEPVTGESVAGQTSHQE
ncbi:hypothetical protein SAMN05216559_2556 [Halomicrobium zhouii]|uniref:Uncharacterized protein n=2 Tax=Halomicrobium zhouii TaxID=767519 RepID=A0A1I6LEH4_9EURY|nr:hypothetical protein SAMN05216559_2556 [Halomicrobium zhouii]